MNLRFCIGAIHDNWTQEAQFRLEEGNDTVMFVHAAVVFIYCMEKLCL